MKRSANEALSANRADGPVPLTGIIVAGEAATHCIRLRTWLRFRQATLQLHIAADTRTLNRALCEGNADFVIVIVASGKSPLPATLRRVLHVHTLVLVESAGIGALPDWLYQGADAVCSLCEPAALRKALDSLIDTCRQRRRLTRLRARGSRQSAMLRGLMSAQSTPPTMLTNGSRLTLRAELAGTAHPLTDQAGTVDVSAWRSWQAQSVRERTLAMPAPKGAGRQASASGFELAVLRTKCSDVVRRRSMKSASRKRVSRMANRETRVIRPVARQSLEQCVASLLTQRPDASACSAMKLYFSCADWEKRAGRLQVSAVSDRLELGIWRATRTLNHHFSSSILLARTERHSLLMLRPACLLDQSQLSASRVRELLGSLGGLIGNAGDIRIQTLSIAPLALSAGELLSWLDDGW